MAYLRQLHRIPCDYHNCSKPALVTLHDQKGECLGLYCRVHAPAALSVQNHLEHEQRMVIAKGRQPEG